MPNVILICTYCDLEVVESDTVRVGDECSGEIHHIGTCPGSLVNKADYVAQYRADLEAHNEARRRGGNSDD